MGKGLKIVTIGGGSSYTPEIVEGMIKRKLDGSLPIEELYLVDIEEGKEKLEIVGNLARRMVEKAGADIKIHLTLDRRSALKDADFVTTQFRVGLLDARIRDEKIPLRYGLLGQETNGAGGFAKAQRTIPVILDICKDMEALCPAAWLINFTNPSGMVTEAVLKHTNIKVVGVCNVPYGIQALTAEAHKVDLADVFIEFAGLNHFVYGRKVYVKGIDKTTETLELFKRSDSFTMRNIPGLEWPFELVDALGVLPCPYHRYYYLKDIMLKHAEEEAENEGTRGEVVKRLEEQLFELYKDPDLNIKPPQLSERGGAHYSDVALNVIDGIYNDRKNIQTVNVRNNGTISDLSDEAAIECNCLIDKSGAHPINVGHLESSIRGLIQIMKVFEELTVEAAVTGDYGTALKALTINPLIGDSVKAKKVLDDIIKENKEYLPQYK
ncbi:6-phospho-beta-glucosidase [Anaerosolibacter carboniphilus]|uniref:6-phospho-beta-glucosidase n=1 Tax=Anaerosolibacter carboniphilus TaxID=1417629 RepID=A0A841KWZ1_9FIRM|nr:6-phospho-beta-glucosidase [Anaerosolibacter carboniphilus]MBB6217877.1 6-phospho-beta-glucosidase [Anaerosolibacter carboniphilus]